MQLEPGKFYRSRNGYKMGPAKPWNGLPDIWELKVASHKLQTELGFDTVVYNTNGAYYDNEHDNPLTLIEEWSDSEDPEKIKTIDQVNFAHLQRGVSRIWDTYRI